MKLFITQYRSVKYICYMLVIVWCAFSCKTPDDACIEFYDRTAAMQLAMPDSLDLGEEAYFECNFSQRQFPVGHWGNQVESKYYSAALPLDFEYDSALYFLKWQNGNTDTLAIKYELQEYYVEGRCPRLSSYELMPKTIVLDRMRSSAFFDDLQILNYHDSKTSYEINEDMCLLYPFTRAGMPYNP